ncbi:hypothetical protein TNCV_2641451 [Trichonephila clavipes]|nr:hypothetical protein TNCV_2641451 [Trichonephila clavipes]
MLDKSENRLAYVSRSVAAIEMLAQNGWKNGKFQRHDEAVDQEPQQIERGRLIVRSVTTASFIVINHERTTHKSIVDHDPSRWLIE